MNKISTIFFLISTVFPQINYSQQDATYDNLTVNDALKLGGGLDEPLSNDHSPHIYRSVYVPGGTFPFRDNGHLVLQPRTSSNRSIVFLNGSTTPVSRMVIQHDGNVGIGKDYPTHKLEIYNSLSFDTNEASASQDHISLDSDDPGNGGFFGGISWKSGGRRRAAIAAAREHSDSDHVGIAFFTQGTDGAGPFYESMRIARSGNVGIGSLNPTSKLTVNGGIHAKEVKVDLNVPGPDYVFEEDYDLPSLESTQHYIRENKHLPEVPSAAEMEENGIDLGVMNMLLLKKVEELTLHLIEQDKRIKELETKQE